MFTDLERAGDLWRGYCLLLLAEDGRWSINYSYFNTALHWLPLLPFLASRAEEWLWFSNTVRKRRSEARSVLCFGVSWIVLEKASGKWVSDFSSVISFIAVQETTSGTEVTLTEPRQEAEWVQSGEEVQGLLAQGPRVRCWGGCRRSYSSEVAHTMHTFFIFLVIVYRSVCETSVLLELMW